MNYAVRVTDFCNLNCEYCYATTDTPHNMDFRTLHNVMDRICEYAETDGDKNITINWTGGEPLLQGVEFFQEIVDIQNSLKDYTFENVIQTNLTLFDMYFLIFFSENNFKLRTSLDLPSEIHNERRMKDRKRVDGFENILAKIRILQNNGIPINVNTVVTSQNIDKAKEIYQFLKDYKVESFSVSRFVLQGNALDHKGLLIAEPGQFGRFLIELYDLWKADADGCLERITPLDNLENACKFYLNQIDYAKACFHCQDQIFAINPHGKVFPSCNKFLAHENTCFGDIKTDTLENIMNSDKRQEFLKKVTSSTNRVCPTCQYASICKGGCFFLAYAAKLESNMDREDFCKGYYFVFEHIIKYLEEEDWLEALADTSLDLPPEQDMIELLEQAGKELDELYGN